MLDFYNGALSAIIESLDYHPDGGYRLRAAPDCSSTQRRRIRRTFRLMAKWNRRRHNAASFEDQTLELLKAARCG